MKSQVFYIYTNHGSITDWTAIMGLAATLSSKAPYLFAKSATALPDTAQFVRKENRVYLEGFGLELQTLRYVHLTSFCNRVVVAYNMSAKDMMLSVEDATAVIYVGPDSKDVVQWLSAHEAISIETGERLMCILPSSIMQKAIDWLGKTSFPQSYMTHPFDDDRLKCVANALYEMGEPIDDATIMHYCLSLNWPELTIYRCINALHAAQKKRLKTEGSYTTESFISIWNIKPKDMQPKSYLPSFVLDSMWGYKSVQWLNIHPDVNILVGITA